MDWNRVGKRHSKTCISGLRSGSSSASSSLASPSPLPFFFSSPFLASPFLASPFFFSPLPFLPLPLPLQSPLPLHLSSVGQKKRPRQPQQPALCSAHFISRSSHFQGLSQVTLQSPRLLRIGQHSLPHVPLAQPPLAQAPLAQGAELPWTCWMVCPWPTTNGGITCTGW